MPMREQILKKLQEAFHPSSLDVVDDSHKHAGHAGARPGGETHFSVRIVSDAFQGLSRVARHRLIHDLLAAELRSTVHALAIQAKTPQEDNG